jgi:hypothetical protein
MADSIRHASRSPGPPAEFNYGVLVRLWTYDVTDLYVVTDLMESPALLNVLKAP